ncbi:archaeal proteasome endopeptidase complex subunit alpha [Halanaeroarchaeum sulfurireducens]|uniref:Proteasome subunit alpha n=1 Tax=Halanaeroarchaeum sulfurireducens TaxID=1604004 RepID=A0A0F7PBK2_9EURY|nr:archaeal proteasome endopeptidase complex subunit alpha [Halanaeroarchaeum sulfurireducens]AKH97024.1 proteasome subunit alpha [Halanaeroarchaeum sulfurireducens]ALG81425.1 proteasome subunit alpha [Halanaeroarchaeum sulfurireducens]
MQGQQQQAYDRGITIFSPDGRLYQVEYAREAVKRGTTSIGVRTADGVVLVVDKRTRSPLMEPKSIEKLHKVADHVAIASAGHVADARQLIDFARRRAQVEELRYEEPMDVEALTKAVTDNIQQYTQVGGARPFGAALLIGGISDDVPRLFETDPSGTSNEWKAVAIGSDRADVQSFLEDEWHDDLSIEEGVELGIRALSRIREESVEPAGLGVGTITVDNPVYEELSDEEIQEYVDDLEDIEDVEDEQE